MHDSVHVRELMMAYRFACERADRVTGVGSVAGAVVIDPCQPSRPVSVIEIHGTEDPLVPYDGGLVTFPQLQGTPEAGPYTATPAMIQSWTKIDGCPVPTPAKMAAPVTTDLWVGCSNGSSVSLVTVQGGGHVWFGADLGPSDGAVDATSTIWRFFAGLHPTG